MAEKMRDPYEILGVSKQASAAEIKKAYRSLAKKFHPDAHGNDPTKSKRFQEISSAYEVVGDKEKRAQFDRGEIDANGQPRGFDPRGHGAGGFQQGGFEGFPGGFEFRTGNGGGGFRAEDIFADILGGLGGGAGRGKRGRQQHVRGEDFQLAATISLEEAAGGGKRRLNTGSGQQLEFQIPSGVREGQQIRLKGKGAEGRNGGPPGDILVTIHLAPHPQFTVEGQDLKLDLPISLKEALLGGKVGVPTLSGQVALTVPPHSNSGQTLRLKGKGLPGAAGKPAGDLYVRLVVALPELADPKLEEFIRGWNNPYDPRAKTK